MYSQTRHPVTSIKQLPVVKGHIFLVLSYKISPDFYLWGYLKDNVYKNNSQTIPEMKREITAKIKLVECVLVIDIFVCHVQVCLQYRRAYLKHILERV